MTEPARLGRYVIDGPLGHGGMAQVFIGHACGAEGFTRRVAIKRVRNHLCNDEQVLAMFVTEAKLGARLEHENIVSILDFQEDDAGGLFIVMEFVDGVDLNDLSRTGPLPLPVALFIASEILQGLAYVHDLPTGTDGLRGLVHRDVSPQNTLLSWNGGVKISDFGIAKARTATQVSGSHRTKGKYAYLSPEYAGSSELDGRSDLFAVGIVLWEMIVGEPLFYRETDAATLKSLLIDEIPAPSSKQPVPPDVEQVTLTLLQRDRDRRYPNAKATLAALKQCADFPKDGREKLSALLIERFPQHVPTRHGGVATPIAALSPHTRTASRPPSPPDPRDGIRAVQRRLMNPWSAPARARLLLALAVSAVVGASASAAVIFLVTRSGAEPAALPSPPALAAPMAPTAGPLVPPSGASGTAAGPSSADSGSAGLSAPMAATAGQAAPGRASPARSSSSATGAGMPPAPRRIIKLNLDTPERRSQR